MLSNIADHDATSVRIRGHDLVEDLLGKITFTEMILLHLTGRRPPAGHVVILDSVLVTLMEHGITPSTIIARLVYDSAPEALQAAVAAGLCSAGSKLIGSMEQASGLIEQILAAADPAAEAAALAASHRREKRILPGFGHPSHRPDDPRTEPMLRLALEQGVPGRHIEALRLFGRAIDVEYGRHITINATGAVAAVLGEIGIPVAIARGLAVVSRSAGLVGHIYEEQQRPTAKLIWDASARAIDAG